MKSPFETISVISAGSPFHTSAALNNTERLASSVFTDDSSRTSRLALAYVCESLPCSDSLIGGSDYKLIYRHYATLYFVFCVDSSESELGILDLIQVLVETLDKCFENVCELDLVFHVNKVGV